MGLIEEKIKQEVIQEIYADAIKIYEFIDTRFKLDDKSKNKIIAKTNSFSEDIAEILKDVKLS
jgi:hypothetical protein